MILPGCNLVVLIIIVILSVHSPLAMIPTSRLLILDLPRDVLARSV